VSGRRRGSSHGNYDATQNLLTDRGRFVRSSVRVSSTSSVHSSGRVSPVDTRLFEFMINIMYMEKN
jgi:hypothetical protein